MEQPCNHRRRDLQEDTAPAGRFAEDSHVVWVASECRDVPLHPPQCELLVHDAVVARNVIGRFRCQCGMGQESQCAKAIIDGDYYHITLFRSEEHTSELQSLT